MEVFTTHSYNNLTQYQDSWSTKSKDNDEWKNSIELQMSVILHVFAPPIFLLFGNVCNILTIILFSRPALNSYMTGYLLRCLAVSDMITLNIGPLIQWINAMFRFNGIEVYIDARSQLSCQIYLYIYITCKNINVWILVLVSMERLVSIVLPFNSETIFTKKNIYIFICLILLGNMLATIPFIFVTKLEKVWFGHICDIKSDSAYVFHFDIVTSFIIPHLIMSFSSIVIIITLLRAHKNRRYISNCNTFQQETKKLKLFTIMLLGASLTHLILSIPYLVYINVYYPFTDNIHNVGAYLCISIWSLCVCMDHSLNFLIYCISGKMARTEFLSMIGCNGNNNRNRFKIQTNSSEMENTSIP